MSDSVIHLANDFIEIGVLPECGAALTYFRTKGEKLFDVMRSASATAVAKRDSLGMAMFLMLPYTHRIKDGEFTYWGIKRSVPANHPMFAEPIHGDGWRTAWKVLEKSATSVKLAMSHSKEKDKGFPFSYDACVVYTLKDKSLDIELSIKNNGIMPMPCGFGIHPYFNRTPNVTLRFNSKNVWYHENDPIDKPYHTPQEWSFVQPRELSASVFDTCFGGFDGNAMVRWPKFGMQLDIKTDEHFSHLVLYAPYRKNFFCLEPTSMACNAFNLASRGVVGTGIQSIGGAETITGQMTLTVSGI